MNTHLKLAIYTFAIYCLVVTASYAQFQQIGPPTQANTYARTVSSYRGIGVGFFPNGSILQSAFQIDGSRMFTPTTDVFRTIGLSSGNNTWRMLTATSIGGTQTEKFVLFNPANSTLVTLQSTQDGMSFNTGGASERMRILANGNIGIGTITPARILEVRTTIPQLRLSNGSGFTEFFTTAAGHLSIAPSGGNVGIGLNTPQSRLHLHNVTTPTITTEQSIYEQYTVDGVLNGTGSLANDGFRVGVRSFWNGTAFQSVAELRQQEAANMNFYN